MYQNILVINLMHLGDLMLVTPALRTLRANYPAAHISLLADRKLADLVQYNEHLDECLLIDKKGKDDHLGSLLRFIRSLRRKKYDLVINLHRNERASALAAFSGAKRIVGYSKPGFSLFFDKVLQNPSIAHHVAEGPFFFLKKAKYVPGWKHQVHAHLEVLREAAGVTKIDDAGLEMWLSGEMESRAEALWRENFSPEDRVIALNIGASWETKRWPAGYFAECADEFIRRGYALAFLGGPMDREIVENCLAQMQEKASPRLRVFTGKVGLGVLGGLLKRCALFLTTDSGPMHIGVAMHTPVVTMFGASPVPGFYPYDARDILIKTPEPCHPCGIHQCPRQGEDNLACMKNIPPATVMRYCHQLLEETGGKTGRELPAPAGFACRVIDLQEKQ